MPEPVEPAAISVFLVDDHQVVREGLRRMLLARGGGITVVGEAGNADEALARIRSCRPDVVLLDLSLPGVQGLDLLPELMGLEPAPRVLVLTVHDDEELVLGAVRAGASGYVLKHTTREELQEAIRRVHAGGHYFSAEVLGVIVESERAPVAAGLSARELQILQLLAAGKSNRQIGDHLYLSPDTVKTHLRNLYRKLGVETRAHAVAVALRTGLLE